MQMREPGAYLNSFARRHIGPNQEEIDAMLGSLGLENLNALIEAAIPKNIRLNRQLDLPEAKSESEALTELRAIAKKNRVTRSFIGAGYYDCITPRVIQRNILENPGWYTAYTPYQAEIAQGRLEALLNYQTVVSDLTALPIANASLLDEATAAAEAMQLAHASLEGRATFLVADDCHPQTIDVVKARGRARGITVKVQKSNAFTLDATVCGVLVQYPSTWGAVNDYRALATQVHAAGALVVAATDLLALTRLVPPGEWGADVAVGNSQRFGVPFGYGGPHAAFFATRDEHKRQMPGRIIGVSKDANGKPALRMALGTREQHIRREKATSNICTAQVLLAVMSGFYAAWHGPEGLRRIADRLHLMAETFAAGVKKLGHTVVAEAFFDTVHVQVAGGAARVKEIRKAAEARRMNLRYADDGSLSVSFGETATAADLADLLAAFNGGAPAPFAPESLLAATAGRIDERFARKSPYLTHPVFNTYHSETEMMRYMRKLESRDLSLTHSMIPLGS